jgi:hypothetical protein
VTDGHAAVRQTRVTVQRDSGSARTYLQVARGDARGTLASRMPLDYAVDLLDQRQIDFVLGRLGFRFTPTGTDVVAEYRRVAEEADGLGRGPVTEQYVELRIAQDLLRMQGRGSQWRLLLAARSSGRDAPEADPGVLAYGPPRLHHWLGAGVSVAF